MIVCKEYACITRTVLINSPTMQQEFLSTKVHHKLLKESKIFNACFFCMHANMMGYFFLDFILTTFFTLGHSIPSTYFKFGHFLYYKNLLIKFFFIFKSKQASTCTEITCWNWQQNPLKLSQNSKLRVNERTSSISRYDVQWLCEVAPSFVYQVTPHLQYTNTQKHNQCVRLPIKRLVQYHTGTCINLNKTHFLQKMMFFAIITSNTDLGTRLIVRIHAIHVPLIIS